MPLLVNRICFRAALRWATTARGHPMFNLVRAAAKQYKNAARSLLNKLFGAYKINPNKIETIQAVRRSPKWIPPIKVVIMSDRDVAQAFEENNSALVKCYSDGSGYNGGIRSSAVMYRGGVRHAGVLKRSLTAYLGTSKRQTVYVGELAGELMNLHLLLTEPPGRGGLGRVSIYVDNQASMQALDSNKPGSGHYIADAIQDTYEKVMLLHPTARITFRWIPSHCFIPVPGNEEADRLAKLGAEQKELSPAEDLPPLLRNTLPHSKSAMDQAMLQALKQSAVRVLRKSKQWLKMKEVDPSMPSTAFRKAVAGMTRGQGSLYIQLRTGNAPLRAHLHKLKAIDSPICQACNNAYETVKHYLMDCPATQGYRRALVWAVGRESRSLKTLLSHKDAIRPLFKFIARTGRFNNDYGQLELKDPEGT